MLRNGGLDSDLIIAVACGEFCAMSPCDVLDIPDPSGKQTPDECGHNHSNKAKNLEGPTIIYVPTRKESVNIAKYLCGVGLKAAAYNAKVWTEKMYFFFSYESSELFLRNENCQPLLTWYQVTISTKQL